MISLFKKDFFIVSTVSNIISLGFTMFIVPKTYLLTSLLCLLFLLMLVESFTKEYSLEQFKNRYIFKIVSGMFITSLSVIFVNKDFVMYVPVLLGILYLNVNTLLNSKLIKYCSIIYFAVPVFKAFVYYSGSARIEYLAIMFVFISVSVMTFYLFNSNRECIADTKNEAQTIKNINDLVYTITSRSVEKEITNIIDIVKSVYKNSADDVVQNTLNSCENIRTIISEADYNKKEIVDLKEIFGMLDYLTSRSNINIDIQFDNQYVYSNKMMMFSTIKNVIENSYEAAVRRGIMADIIVRKYGNIMTIKDNCGGFDMSKIESGYSAKQKTEGNEGLFLKTITSPYVKTIFNFNIDVRQIENGTQIDIAFL